ncbi:MAG: RICIN domain-containing protein, partial [Chloroflexi bacterium]
LNSGGNQLQVIFGGRAGSSAVAINGLSAFGATVHVRLEYSPSLGRTTAVSGPIVISDTDYTVSGGSITVPVVTNASDGYHLVITPSGTSTTLAGRYQITNRNSGLALDTQNDGTGQGSSVVQATSTTGTDQNWTLTAAGAGLYKIANQKSGLVLGISNESTSDGGTALIWGDNGTPDHLWQFIPAPGGRFKIANFNSGLVLGVSNQSTATGAQVLQWDDNGTPDHLWTLTAR